MSRASCANGKRYEWDGMQHFERDHADRKAKLRRSLGLLARVRSVGDGWGVYTHEPEGWETPSHETVQQARKEAGLP